MLRDAMRNNDRKALWVLLLPALLFLPPALMNLLPWFMDIAAYFFPLRAAMARQLAAGHLPLWTPSICAGVPLLANPQLGFFYPANWLFFLVPRAGMMTFLFGVHMFLGGWGTYLWLRERRFMHGPALASALLAEVSGAMWAHLAFGSYLFTMALFPWFMFCFERFRNRGEPRCFAGMAMILALQLFSGSPQVVYYSSILYFDWALLRLFSRKYFHRELRALGAMLLAMFIGTALAAVQLWPARDLVMETTRMGDLPLQIIRRGSLNFARTLEAFLGNNALPQDTGDAAYIGAAGFLFLLLGFLASQRKRRILDVILFLRLMIIGIWPISGYLATYLPGYARFHDPRRVLALAPFVAAPLICRGLTSIRLSRPLRRAGKALYVFLAGSAVLWLWQGGENSFQLHPALGWIPNVNLGMSKILSAILLAAFFLFMIRSWKRRRLWWGIAVGIMIIEVLNYSFCRLDTKFIPEKRVRPPQAAALRRDQARNVFPRIIAFDASGHYSYNYTRPDFADTWMPNLAAFHGVSDFQGYEPLRSRRYTHLLTLVNEPSGLLYPSHFGLVRGLDSPLLETAGVTHGIEIPTSFRDTWDRLPPDDGGETRVFRLKRPGFLFVFETLPFIARSREEAAGMLRSQARREKVRISPRPVIEHYTPQPILGYGGAGDAEIRVLEYREGRARLEIDTSSGGYLVFRETWFPDWRVFLDGEEAENLNADIAFQAAWVPEGRHEVVWEYRPASLRRGAVVSLLALLLLVFTCSAMRRRQRMKQ